jgi:hypothetical protein
VIPASLVARDRLLLRLLQSILLGLRPDLNHAALREQLGRALEFRQLAYVVPPLRVIGCPFEHGGKNGSPILFSRICFGASRASVEFEITIAKALQLPARRGRFGHDGMYPHESDADRKCAKSEKYYR